MTVRKTARAAIALALAALATPGAAGAAGVGNPQPDRPAGGAGHGATTSDRVIVVYEPGTSATDRADARDDADTTLLRTLGATRFQLVTPEPGQSVADAIATLRDDPAVRVAERDGSSELHGTPSDPLFGQLWGLRNLGLGVNGFSGAIAGLDVSAVAAWDRTVGTPSTVVADLDAGYRFDHPDLAPVTWDNPADPANGVDDDGNGLVDDAHGADFVGSSADSPRRDGDPTDDNLLDGGHGVHTAGTIGAAGDDGVGVTGVARNVRIMPLRVCAYSTSAGRTSCPTSSQIDAINYAGAHGARVANMSLGGTTPSTAQLNAFASNPRTLFVVSAGNDTQDNDPGGTPHYPCAYDPTTSGIPGAVDNIVCVAATDQADGLAGFSDWGRTTVDLGAPGTEVLSTYPVVPYLDDTFTVDDFSAKWSATGASGGFARTNESPLTSFGMSDSPGGAPVANSVRESTSAAVTLPPGFTSCRITQSRQVSLGATGSYTYSVLLNGVSLASSSPSSSGAFFLDVASGLLAAGGSLQLRFRYAAGSSPGGADGVWLDNISFRCIQPPGQSTAYGFLNGTSMAAPHVTGAAALLFSLKPAATVAEVKSALLGSVDPAASLSGRTVTGGRLDAAAALDLLVPPGSETVPPETAILSAPSAQTTSQVAAFVMRRADADGGTLECRLDGSGFAPCAGAASYPVGTGAHQFEVRARDPFGHVDPTPATASWTVVAPPVPPPPGPPVVRPTVQCVVPRLAGKTLRQATTALRAAHCALGRVTRPRARRGRRLPPLVVAASSPRAGARLAGGARVAVTLKAKPRARRRARRR